MRNLAYGPWSHEQVITVMRAGTGRIRSRFEVRDIDGNLVGDLAGYLRNEQGAQMVEISLDQTIKGGARYRMLPVEDLRRRALNLFVHAFFAVEMAPDRWAEYPMGVHVWMPPESSIWTNGVEEWSVALGDITTLLELWDPGAAGYTVPAGTRLGEALRGLFAAAGMPEWVSVPDIDVPLAQSLWWAPRTPRALQAVDDQIQHFTGIARRGTGTHVTASDRAKAASALRRVIWLKQIRAKHVVFDGRTTGLQIASELCEAAGFDPPVVSWDGTVEVRPASQPQTAPPELAYASERDSLLMLPLRVEPDLSKFRNRVVVSPQSSTTESSLKEGVADLNTLMPTHPFAQRNLSRGGKGFYISELIVDDKATTQAALNARAIRELFSRLVGYEEIAFSSRINLAHEPGDPCSMRIDGHPEFGSAQTFLTRRLAADLYDGTMTHQHARTFLAGLQQPV